MSVVIHIKDDEDELEMLVGSVRTSRTAARGLTTHQPTEQRGTKS